MSNAPVLVVDDDPVVREALSQTLELEDIAVIATGSFIEAKDHISADFAGVILSDMRMPGRDGFHLLDYSHGLDAELPVILLTGEGDIPMAVKAMGKGAFGFLEKPCAPADLTAVIARAQKTRDMVLENRRLKAQLETGDAAARMLFGESTLAEELRGRVRAVSRAGAEVLVTGAPGSGTSKVAEVIHLLSDVSMHSFEKLSAASATPQDLADAMARAEGGTLFIDGVASLSDAAQFALIEMLDEGAGARVIAGTYKDIDALVQGGAFNTDLFYKLDVMRVRIPALSQRPEDIPILFRHYVAIACEQAALPQPEITPDVIARLMAQDWPGNARALMNAAMRFAMGLSETTEDTEEAGLSEKMARVERSLLIDALRRARGNATEASKALKLPRKTFYDRLARHQIRPELYR